MEKFYIRFGRRHALPSTRQILAELGQRREDRLPRHSRIVWPQPVFGTDIYGRKLNR